jgi:hypothetical protein
MPGLLDAHNANVSSESFKRPAVVFACCTVALLFTFFGQTLHLLHDNASHHTVLYLVPLLPVFFAAVFGTALPLLVFISYEKDFPAPFNPFRPKDYWTLCKRCIAAVNNGKISAKDL